MSIKYISQKVAQQIDEELMSSSGAFSLDQLMELAGLACAQALARTFPRDKHSKVMVVCGPGNQGGDGLVAARHLHMFRYKPTIYLPKPGSKDIYQRLLRQCENLKIPVLGDVEAFEKGLKEHDVILDAIFGFSFHPPVRKPFDRILTLLKSSSLPILSVDIPSGWSVEDGPQELFTEKDDQGKQETVETFTPEALISLTAPKLGVKGFEGRHWLGGRFVPEKASWQRSLSSIYPSILERIRLWSYRDQIKADEIGALSIDVGRLLSGLTQLTLSIHFATPEPVYPEAHPYAGPQIDGIGQGTQASAERASSLQVPGPDKMSAKWGRSIP